jgi:outer membrane lipoprotein carrier protein
MAVVKYWCQNAINLALASVLRLGARSLRGRCVGRLTVSALSLSALSLSVLVLSLSAPTAAAGESLVDDRTLLSKRLSGLTEFAATFTQEIQGARGQVMERSTGYVRLKRPLFKWVVDDPYPQIIVTEGDVLKVYDPDLEQLTIRPLAEALTDTPISLLTHEDVVLGDTFDVVRIAGAVDGDATDTGGSETFIITPRSEDTLYAEIRLHFSADALTTLGIVDHLGQFTEIHFKVEPPTTVIQSSDFELEVPPGTDVIGG